nr:MAG TPA: helix-turn-helix domain protein [Caudoviricetes sp.]
MAQGERVKEIRKGLNLTLEKFGERVGVTKQTVSRIENGVNNLTDQMTLAICREFSVNEHWLRTGEGEPYIKGSDDELAELVGRLYKDKGSMRYKMSLELCRSMEKMTDEQLMAFAEFVKRLAEAATPEE